MKLLKSINARLADVGSETLGEQFLEETFNLFWGLLEPKLKEAEKLSDDVKEKNNEEPTPQRGEREMLNDVLELMRDQQRRLERIEESIGFSGAEGFLPPNLRNKIEMMFLAKRLYITYTDEISDKARRVVEEYLKSLFGACQVEFVVFAGVNTIIVTFSVETPLIESSLNRLSDNLGERGLGKVRITHN